MALTNEEAKNILGATRQKIYGIVGKNIALNYDITPKEAIKPGEGKGPCIVTASGATLMEVAGDLQRLPYRIISGPTHKGYLEKIGIKSDLMVYDHGPQLWPYIGTKQRNTTLYMHPGIDPIVRRKWTGHGPVKWYWWYIMPSIKYADGETVEHFIQENNLNKDSPAKPLYNDPYISLINHYVPMLYPELPRLLAATCTPLMAAVLAMFEGYKPIYFLGLDFGWTGKTTRTLKHTFAHGKWTPEESKEPKDVIELEGMKTTRQELFYRRVLANLLLVPGVEIYNLLVPGFHSLAVCQSMDYGDIDKPEVLADKRAEHPKYLHAIQDMINKGEV